MMGLAEFENLERSWQDLDQHSWSDLAQCFKENFPTWSSLLN
jgi:hypothetical protein